MKKTTPILLIIICVLLSSCRSLFLQRRIGEKDVSGSAKYKGEIHVLLYFSDPALSYLVPEDRIAGYDKSLEKTIVKELLKGPRLTSAVSPIPAGTRLLGVSRSGDTVAVNLSGEFKRNHPVGSTGEIMSIYSIADSLTEIPGVDKVLFRIDGKPVSIPAGHMELSKPISRNRTLLKRNKTLSPTEALKLQMTLESQGKWLDAYVLLSDDPRNPDRKYFADYVTEMEEVRQLGFTSQKFMAGDYKPDKSGTIAGVRVDFYDLNPDGSKKIINTAYFNTVKIEGAWMVDWSTTQ